MNADIRQLEQLNHVFMQVMGEIFLAPYSNEVFNEMTGAQKKILYLLGIKGPQKMSDIANQVAVTISGATGIVDRMVKCGLVARESASTDRRVIIINLTAQGRKALKQLQQTHEQRLEEVLKNLAPRKRVELIAAFAKIHDLLTELRSASTSKRGK